MVKFTFEIAGTDFSGLVERDSYETRLSPVYSAKITDMAGVEHFVLLRNRGILTVGLNPQKAADMARFCAAVLDGPVAVRYHCLQRNADVYAEMALDSDLTAKHLSRCLYQGAEWSELETVTLREL